ncbi:hypothetical protein [Nonomuraea sp. NPDC049309]|uniref:hypothetical protein n=1 Tax=Nonomuraea sp. NPDC049309 TaxID=3364350 RepID=UPI0037234BCD
MLRPGASGAIPAVRLSAATGSTHASCIHDGCGVEACRARWIAGRLTAAVTTGRWAAKTPARADAIAARADAIAARADAIAARADAIAARADAIAARGGVCGPGQFMRVRDPASVPGRCEESGIAPWRDGESGTDAGRRSVAGPL